MKRGKKQKQKDTQPAGKNSGAKLTSSAQHQQETPADRTARRERRRQEKVQCAVQCKKYIKQLQEDLLQPSRKHYGGLGYAKESLFVPLDDPQYTELFQEIWDEHIPGFSGKSFKKRKSESAGNMLWRQRLKARQEGVTSTPVEDIVNASLVPGCVKSQAKVVSPGAVTASNRKQMPQQPKASKATVAAGASPELQAQVMAAYRTMKLKKWEMNKTKLKGPPQR